MSEIQKRELCWIFCIFQYIHGNRNHETIWEEEKDLRQKLSTFKHGAEKETSKANRSTRRKGNKLENVDSWIPRKKCFQERTIVTPVNFCEQFK